MADGSVTIEVKGDANELISAFKQAAAQAEALASTVKGVSSAFQSAATAAGDMGRAAMANAADEAGNLDSNLDNAADAGRKLDSAVSGGKVASELESAESAAKSLDNSLNGASEAMNGAGSEMDRTGESADDLGESMDEAGDSATRFGSVFKDTFLGNLAAKGVELAASAVQKLGDALIDCGKKALQGYADYQQNIGGVETLFGDAAGTVEQYAANAFKSNGISANQYMETVTSYAAALVSGLGGNVHAAAEVANTAISDMADNSAKLGTDISSIQDAYNGFAKQNYTMLDNLKLGYGGTQSEMVRLINDSGVLNEKISSMDGISLDTIIAAIHKTQENLGMAGTAGEEALTTISGSVQALGAAWDNWLAGLANPDADLTELTANLISALGTAIQNVVPAVGQIFLSLGTLIKDSFLGLFDGETQQQLTTAFGGIRDAFSGLGEALSQVFTPERREAIAGVFEVLGNTVLPAVLTAIATAITVVVNIITAAIPIVETIVSFLAEKIPQAIGVVIAIIQTAISVVQSIISFFTETIPNAIQTAIEWFQSLPQAILDAVTSALEIVANWASDLAETIGNGASDAVSAVGSFFAGLPGTIGGWLTTGLSTVAQWAGSLISQMGSAALGALRAVGSGLASLPSTISGVLANALAALVRWGVQMASQARAKMMEVGRNILNALKSVPSQMLSMGHDIVQGLINGIRNKIAEVGKAASELASSVINKVKGLFNINSPSKVMEEIGDFVVQGLANGITKNAYKAKVACRTLATVVTKAVEDLNDQIEAIEAAAAERSAKKEIAEHEKAVKEKNEAIAKAEEKDKAKLQEELAKLEADWQEKQLQKQESAQKEALKAQISTLEELKSNYEKALNDVEKERDSLKNKLSDVDLVVKDGNFFTLANLQTNIDQINEFGDKLEELKKRGISDSLLSEVTSMSRSDAIQYANALLRMTDAQFDEYLDQWETLNRVSTNVSNNVYREQINAVKKEYFDKLPDEFKTAGDKAMGSFGDAITSKKDSIIAAAKEVSDGVIKELDRINAAASLKGTVLEVSSATSARLTSATGSRADRANANKAESLSDLVNAIAVANGATPQNKEIVLTLNGREVARGLIDDIRAVDDQSPRIISA